MTPLKAQDAIENFTQAYTGENGAGYIGPLVDAFFTSLNTGLFPLPNTQEGVHVRIGLVGTAAFIPASMTLFDATTEAPFRPQQTAEVPTVFGPTDPVLVQGVSGTAYVFPAGFDVSYVPLAVPQAQIGNLYGTDLNVRYFAISLDETVENIQLLGIGIRHNLGQWLGEETAVDLNLAYSYQQFGVGDLIDARSHLFQVQVGKTLGIFNFYGVAGYQQGTFDLFYEYESSEGMATVDLNLDTENNLKLGAGFALRLSILHLHAEYNLGTPNVLAAGLGFGF